MASDSPAVFEAVLRQAEMARVTNFDLIGDGGYKWLIKNIAADFPAMSLAELSGIICRGIKGEFDKSFVSGALNVTRVYKWVKASQGMPTEPTPESKWPAVGKETEGQVIAIACYGQDEIMRRHSIATKQRYWPTAIIHPIF